MFKRRIPQNDWEQQHLRQEEKRTEILARGPKQPCPSNWEWEEKEWQDEKMKEWLTASQDG